MPRKFNDLEHTRRSPEQKGTVIAHHGVAVMVRWAGEKDEMTRVPRNSGFLVGDCVYWDNTKLKRKKRVSELKRATTAGQTLSVAANIDCVGIVVAPKPDTSTSFIDQVVVTTKAADIESILILNKNDLSIFTEFEEKLRGDYDKSIPIYSVSAKNNKGLESVRHAIAQYGRSIWVGASGVGKSSLVNSLLQHQSLSVGPLSEVTGFGKHTTTTATLHTLKGGGEIVDTPGVREFIPVKMAPQEIAQFFPGFETTLVQACRFHNCLHHKEPGCAIKEAVEKNLLSPNRYQVYLNLLEQTEKRNQPSW